MSGERLQAQVRLALDRFRVDVDFETAERVTGVFGPSGCGKTSLLEAIVGLRPGARGVIRLGDALWQSTAEKRFVRPESRDIGYVPQDVLLFPHKNVRENLLSGAARAVRNGRDVQFAFDTVVELLELGSLLERGVATLSGGEGKRVALGRALCSGPRLLVLDEPLGALDLPLRRRVLPFLRRVRSEFEIPMLLVSHDPTEVQALCDDLLVMREGRVVSRGTPHEVLTNPALFAAAGDRAFENVLPCELVRSEGDSSLLRCIGGEATLWVSRLDGQAGDQKLVGIGATDIMIATARPTGLSAQNVLPARLVAVHALDRRRLVTAHLGGSIPPLAVEVSDRACETLGLSAGLEIFVILKSAGCTVYDARADAQADAQSSC